MNYFTLNNIKDLFQLYVDNNQQIKRFGFGVDFDVESMISTKQTFPCLYAVLQNIDYTAENLKTYNFNILIFDLLKNDKSNQNDVWSDSIQQGEDVIRFLNWNSSNNFNVVGQPKIETFTEKFSDFVAGVNITISIETDSNLQNDCGIPETDFTFNIPSFLPSSSSSSSGSFTCADLLDCSTFLSVSGQSQTNYDNIIILSGNQSTFLLKSVFEAYTANTQTNSVQVQNGNNIYTGGTTSLPTVNLVDSPSINGLTSSGSSVLNTVSATTLTINNYNSLIPQIRSLNNRTGLMFDSLNVVSVHTNSYQRFAILSAGTIHNGSQALSSDYNTYFTGQTLLQTVSASTIYSGVTELGSVFASKIHSHPQYATLSGATFTGDINGQAISATTIYANKYFSAGTDLYNIFATSSSGSETHVQGGSNISTGGTATIPTINLVSTPSVNGLLFSGSVIGNSLSASTLSGGTIYSGVTELGSVFASQIHSHSQYATLSGANFTGSIQSGSTDLYNIFSTRTTSVQNGSNISTGGTASNPTVNLVSSPSINGLTFSGSAVGSSLSATTISGGTLYSGSTNLYNIFATSTAAASFLNIDYTDSAVTGTLSETILYSKLIPANTFVVGDLIYISARWRKTGTAGTHTPKIRIHTSNAVAGNTIYGSTALGATNLTTAVLKLGVIKGSTNTEFGTLASGNDESPNSLAGAYVSYNIDWTVDQYIIFTGTLANIADTETYSFSKIQIV